MKLGIAALLLFLVGWSPNSNLLPYKELLEKEEKIHWSENRKLTWADFQGIPNRSNEFVASTNSGVSFSLSYRERDGVMTIQTTVLSSFYPKLSWFRPSRVTNYILAHEQLHFDISELHARKLRKGLESIVQDRDFKKKAEAVYNTLEAERRAMQNQYDSDSDHSNRKEEEYRWRSYVAQQLLAYDDWK